MRRPSAHVQELLVAKSRDYTGCWLHNIPEYEKLAALQTIYVQNLPSGGKWVEGGRPDGAFYEEDLLTDACAVKGVLKGMSARIAELLAALEGTTDFCSWAWHGGIFTVADLRNASDDVLLNLSTIIDGVSFEKLVKWRAMAVDAREGAAPNFILDHIPYASRYGERAEEEMAKSLRAKGHVCVKELVLHMIIETAKTFEGTTHEKDWLFFHDALSQLCDARTVKWMQETKDDHGVFYYDRWLLPANDLNAGTVFANRPTGDSPALAGAHPLLFQSTELLRH